MSEINPFLAWTAIGASLFAVLAGAVLLNWIGITRREILRVVNARCDALENLIREGRDVDTVRDLRAVLHRLRALEPSSPSAGVIREALAARGVAPAPRAILPSRMVVEILAVHPADEIDDWAVDARWGDDPVPVRLVGAAVRRRDVVPGARVGLTARETAPRTYNVNLIHVVSSGGPR